MKKAVLFLVLLAVTGLIAFFGVRWCQSPVRNDRMLLDTMPELEWLRKDLQLTDAQFDRVAKLHAEYRPQCMEMCRRIDEAGMKVEAKLRQNREITPELEAAVQEHARVRAECRLTMLKHIYDTARLLNEEQAARYLDDVMRSAVETNAKGAVHHGGN